MSKYTIGDIIKSGNYLYLITNITSDQYVYSIRHMSSERTYHGYKIIFVEFEEDDDRNVYWGRDALPYKNETYYDKILEIWARRGPTLKEELDISKEDLNDIIYV